MKSLMLLSLIVYRNLLSTGFSVSMHKATWQQTILLPVNLILT